MSNRLEHEFPEVRWQAGPPERIDHDLVRHHLEQARRLRSEAIRAATRAALAAARTVLARAAAVLGDRDRGRARQRSDCDRWAGAAPGA
jgi:hypothetical protein